MNDKMRLMICACVWGVLGVYCCRARACCQAPFADFLVHPYMTECVDVVLTFDSAESGDPDGTECTFRWDFGDGTTAEGRIVTHSYSEPGVYDVNLTVTDNDDPDCCGGQPGCKDKSDSCVQTITIRVENPQFVSMLIAFKKAGFSAYTYFSTNWLDPPQFEGVKYDPAYVCWCAADCKTSAGRRYEHAHTPVGFPFSYDINHDGVDETITADDSKAFWDDYYLARGPYVFVSPATVQRNCHGYAADKDHWINGEAMFYYVLADDYIQVFGDDIPGATIYTTESGTGPPTHTIKITQWENGKIKETCEKNREGPVYKRVYNPALEPNSSWRYWKPK